MSAAIRNFVRKTIEAENLSGIGHAGDLDDFEN